MNTRVIQELLIEEGTYLSENELTTAILKDRNKILTAAVRGLQESIAALKKTAGNTYRTSLRMADFAAFALRLAEARGEAVRAGGRVGNGRGPGHGSPSH